MDDETVTFELDPIVLDEPLAPATHRIDIAFHKYGPKGTYYRVTNRGETLIESIREPVYSSCRALVAMGCNGRLRSHEPRPLVKKHCDWFWFALHPTSASLWWPSMHVVTSTLDPSQ